MGFMDKVYRQLGLTDPEEEILEREEAELRADELAAKARKEKAMDLEKNDESSQNVVDFQAAAAASGSSAGSSASSKAAAVRMNVIVIEPKSFDDAQQVANNLREKKPVVLNFEHTEGESAKRILDFIGGTTYALNGEIKKVGKNVFLCAPHNVNIAYMEDSNRFSSSMPWMKK